ncbi:hypothetical protein FRC00_011953, partial [Tulasnella sp. 408]
KGGSKAPQKQGRSHRTPATPAPRTVKSKLPKIVNDHVWTGCNALLVRQDDEKTKEAVLKLQSDFLKQGVNDPSCDTKGIGGEDLENNPWRE